MRRAIGDNSPQQPIATAVALAQTLLEEFP